MKNLLDPNLQRYIVKEYAYDEKKGVFLIPYPIKDNKIIRYLFVLIQDKCGWEHASVSIRCADGLEQIERCPKWDEMKIVKELFWNDNEVVIQIHPKKSEYININEWVLHLWKLSGKEFEFDLKEIYKLV